MTGSSTGASIDTTTYCAILPSIVGMPKGRIPPLDFGISTSFTTLGKLQPTHAIPYLMKFDFSFRTIHIGYFFISCIQLKKNVQRLLSGTNGSSPYCQVKLPFA